MKKILFVLLLSLSAAQAVADKPATHGMLLFGNKTLYASHLPMFHAPHDYQLIMKISLNADIQENKIALDEYKKLKIDPQNIFTLEPEPMDLTQIISGQIKNFKASLYWGHFEKSGRNLGHVYITIEQILYSAQLNPTQEKQNEYLVFGEKGDFFAAHLIKNKPSFDQILTVEEPMQLTMLPCRALECPKRYRPIPSYYLPITLRLQKSNSDIAETGDVVRSFDPTIDKDQYAKVLNNFYLELEELSH